MSFTEAEELEMEIPESWKGDTRVILASVSVDAPSCFYPF